MDWLEVTIPQPSAIVIAQALQQMISDEAYDNPHELKIAMDLRDFFGYAAQHPRAFPPHSMAPALKARSATGFAGKTDTPSRKRRRATRHQRRLEAAKLRRKNRAESVDAHNRALNEQLRVEGDESGPGPLWKRIIPGRGAGRHEVEGPSTDDQG